CLRIGLCNTNQRAAVSRLYDLLGLERRGGRYMVLRQIYFAEGGRKTPADIASELKVTSANITYLVKGLVQDGLVRRAQADSDRRTRHVELTDAGVELCRQVVPAIPDLM